VLENSKAGAFLSTESRACWVGYSVVWRVSVIVPWTLSESLYVYTRRGIKAPQSELEARLQLRWVPGVENGIGNSGGGVRRTR
jgi:hypothetical protein